MCKNFLFASVLKSRKCQGQGGRARTNEQDFASSPLHIEKTEFYINNVLLIASSGYPLVNSVLKRSEPRELVEVVRVRRTYHLHDQSLRRNILKRHYCSAAICPGPHLHKPNWWARICIKVRTTEWNENGEHRTMNKTGYNSAPGSWTTSVDTASYLNENGANLFVSALCSHWYASNTELFDYVNKYLLNTLCFQFEHQIRRHLNTTIYFHLRIFVWKSDQEHCTCFEQW